MSIKDADWYFNKDLLESKTKTLKPKTTPVQIKYAIILIPYLLLNPKYIFYHIIWDGEGA